jgi:hypothetical protein
MTTKIQFPGSKLETTQSIVNKITSTSSTGSIEIANYTKLSGNPRFLVTKAADQAFTTSLATVTFDTEVFDTGSDHSAGVFTVPVTGVYEFVAYLGIKAINAGDTTSRILLKVNSDVTNELFSGSLNGLKSTAALTTVGGSRILSLTAADTVEVQIIAANATTVTMDKNLSSFSGRLIST